MPKFPFTNYHELNLDWILKKVEALFTASEENARTIRTYDNRLTYAELTATNAGNTATAAQQLADAAAANADNALSVAGTADAKADSALTASTDARNAASNSLTIAQEAQQTAGAAVATANDAAATASGLESLANTANQNATAAVETAGTAVTTANNAATAANTADQKAVAAQQTANSAQSAAATNAGNITALQTNVTDLNRQLSESITPAIEEIETALDGKAPVIVNTASGEIASFDDGADGMPVKSLIANIEPVQDLHGYANPWPAGGGKNMLQTTGTNLTKSGVTYTVKDDGSVIVNGTSTAVDPYTVGTVNLIGGTIYVLSSSATNDTNFFLQAVGSGISSTNTANGAYTFSPPSDMTATIRIVVNPNKTVNNVTIKPMLCLSTASDPTSFSPYSNICPISGHTGASVTRTGKNVLPFFNRTVTSGGVTVKGNSDGTYSWTGTSAGNVALQFDVNVPITNGVYRFVSSVLSITGVGNISLYYNDITGTTRVLYSGNTIDLSSNEIIKIAFFTKAGASVNSPSVELMLIPESETDTTFEPYQSDSLSITFPSSAGTVYGGTLDVTNGVLTVTDANIASYNGETLTGEWISDRDVYAAGTTPTTGAQVVYKLATSQTYQLTAEQVSGILETLYGTNNIWTDVGTVDVQYPADTKLYIDGKIAELQALVLEN